MRRILTSAALALAAAMTMTTASWAQGATAATAGRRPVLELAFTYQGTLSDLVSGSRFWMEGGAAQIHGRFYGGWGAVADVAGAHIANINSTGVGLDLITATFGPRYTWQPAHGRWSFYGQGLVGEAIGMNSVFPNASGAQSTANSIAVKAGAGLNADLTSHFALRIFEADYLRTQFPNSTNNAQNNLSLGAGVVLRFR